MEWVSNKLKKSYVVSRAQSSTTSSSPSALEYTRRRAAVSLKQGSLVGHCQHSRQQFHNGNLREASEA
jgi:hypothetical protein